MSDQTSGPAGAEVAEVLAGLVEEMRALARTEYNIATAPEVDAVYECIALVEAAQQKAATGARAAVCPTRCDDDCDTDCHEHHQVPAKRRHDVETCPGARAAGGDDEVIERAGEAALDVFHPHGSDDEWEETTEAYRQVWRDVARAVLAAAPAAPGVAELLAECRWRLDEGVGQPFTPSEILHYLVPEGGQS